MSKKFKQILSIIMLALSLATFSVNVFAANTSYKTTASYASKELVDVECNFKKAGTDSVTVKNNGRVNMWVYVNGAFYKEIGPGQTYTYSTFWLGRVRVQVYAVKQALGTQNIAISTTSGTIKNK